MNRELLEALVRASAELQRAHRIAIDSGRRDIADLLRSASIDIADSLVLCVPDRSMEVRS